MNKLIPLIALSSLTLTACLDESGNDDTSANNTNNAVQNPFAVASNDQQQVPTQQVPTQQVPTQQVPTQQVPTQQVPTQQVPTQQVPTQQVPTQQLPTSNDLSAVLINGANATSANSYWSCKEQTEIGAISMAFFANGSGEINDSLNSADITWALDGPYMDININADFYAQLSDFDVSTSGLNFEVNYVVYDGTVGALACDLVSSEADATTNSPAVPGQVTASSGGDLLINTLSDGVLQDIWICHTADGDSVAVFFDNDGSGMLSNNSDYPEGITLNWTMNSQAIELVLADGNQVQLISPVISQDYFQADTVIVNGSSSGHFDCERITES